MMATHPYSHKYYPPAPVMEIALLNSNEMLRVEALLALVDTGADNTIVPIHYLDDIAVPATIDRFIRTPWGDRHPVTLYLVDVQINGLTLPGLEVVGDEWVDDVIIGRDILNRLWVLLDGPKQAIKISG